jgi:hypothetical protein
MPGRYHREEAGILGDLFDLIGEDRCVSGRYQELPKAALRIFLHKTEATETIKSGGREGGASPFHTGA